MKAKDRQISCKKKIKFYPHYSNQKSIPSRLNTVEWLKPKCPWQSLNRSLWRSYGVMGFHWTSKILNSSGTHYWCENLPCPGSHDECLVRRLFLLSLCLLPDSSGPWCLGCALTFLIDNSWQVSPEATCPLSCGLHLPMTGLKCDSGLPVQDPRTTMPWDCMYSDEKAGCP